MIKIIVVTLFVFFFMITPNVMASDIVYSGGEISISSPISYKSGEISNLNNTVGAYEYQPSLKFSTINTHIRRIVNYLFSYIFPITF